MGNRYIANMKRYFISAIFLFSFGLASHAQNDFAFWKKDREYAENAFLISTSGPVPGVGLGFSHQLSKKATLTAFYGEASEVKIEAGDDFEVGDDNGNNEVKYTGVFAENSSWSGVILNYRPFEKAQGVRLQVGAGVGRLGGHLKDPNMVKYFVSGSGTFMYMGAGYGLRPVKGLQLGLDIGWLRAPEFDVKIAGSATPNAETNQANLRRELNNFTYIPNAQITLAWGF